MRKLLRFQHILVEETSGNSSLSRSRGPCNKQTINAGDNPCPSIQSPLPYMLAGLAAMVLLVVISLMILACSYLRGYFSLDRNSSPGTGGNEDNPKMASLQSSKNDFAASPEKIVVILAGEDKPTHLAQPIELYSDNSWTSSDTGSLDRTSSSESSDSGSLDRTSSSDGLDTGSLDRTTVQTGAAD